MLTNSGPFILGLLFNKMALIFIGVLIVFPGSSFPSFNKSDCLD